MPLPRRTFLGASAFVLAACSTTAPPAGRTVDSAHGPIAVPDRAERVVALDLSKIQRMLDVGVEPVGVVEGWRPLAAHTDWYARVPKVGTQAAPSLEAVAALRPDLVLGSPQGIDDALYGRLSALAPTVVLAARGLGADWKDLSAADARAAGREAELAALRDRYAARVAEVRLGDRSWAALYGIPDGAYSLLPESGPGVVLADLGARFADPTPGIYQQVSYEELSRFAAADVLLVDAQAGGALTGATTALLAAPTFAALPGRVVPASHLLVFSYGEAMALLDQLDGAR
jgi:ABC-type Fe3+-hydroxamate transport system substrate-binding protein